MTYVAALESTQQEAETRVILHSIHSVQKEDVERIIIHTNDTDNVVISCMYYASTLLRDLSELSIFGSHRTRWNCLFLVRTALGSYLPIHGIAAAVGPSTSHALPFIHSLSERHTTSYSYFTGKKTCIKSSMQIDIQHWRTSPMETKVPLGSPQKLESRQNSSRSQFMPTR